MEKNYYWLELNGYLHHNNFFYVISFSLVLLVSTFQSLSQNNQSLKFSTLSLSEGLSQSVVFQTIQDKDGFLWFGTQDGLNKYDGYEFTVYRNQPNDKFSLSNNCILSILEDNDGNLWIGTRGGGLNRFDKNSESFCSFTNNPKDSQSLSNNFIYCLFEDDEGIIWIGTNGGGLNKFDKNTGKFKSFKNEINNFNSISNDIVCSIVEEDSLTLWIGTLGGGLNYFNKKTESFKSYQNDRKNPNSISNNNIKSVFIDSNDILWVGTNGGGLDQFDKDSEHFIHFTNNPDNPNSLSNNFINAIYETSSGMLCIATHGGGLNIFDRNSGKFDVYIKDPLNPTSLSSSYPISLFEDQSKTLWIGTYGGGLSSYSKYRSKFGIYKNDPLNPKSISTNTIRSFYIDKSNTLWVGTRSGGLNKYDSSKGEFKAYKNIVNDNQSLSNNAIYFIIEDELGFFWIGTSGGGLNKFDPKTGKAQAFRNDPSNTNSLSNDFIYYLLDDQLGSIWIGTDGGGLNRFDKKTGKFTVYKNNLNDSLSISDNIIISIYNDKQGRLWLGTRSGGLSIFDPKTEKAVVYKNDPTDSNSIPNNSVLSIVEDEFGTIWIGTDGGGLNLVSTDSFGRLSFKSYTDHDGLPNNCIYGIVGDIEGNLWLSTNKGISKISPYISKLNRQLAPKPLVQNFDFNDGLPSNEFNTNAYYRGNDGTIYMGTIAGVVYFNPNSVIDNKYLPPVVITGFQLFNKDVEVLPNTYQKNKKDENVRIISKNGNYYLSQAISKTKGITLTADEKVFTFEFASLDFSIPLKNKYEYIMEGFDKDWNRIGTRRFATYTNLPNGHYTFKVRGTNCDDLWSNSIASINITILPPFWKTTWFRLLVLFSFVFFVITYIKWRERKLNEDKDILEATVRERTMQLKDANEELNQQKEELQTINEKLVQHKIDLEQANATKDKFFGIIAHDLRNPFNSLLGFSDFLIEKIKEGDFNESFKIAKIIHQSSSVAHELLENLLNWSLSQTGKISFTPENQDLKLLVDANLLLLSNNAESKGIVLTSLIKERVMVFADKNMVVTILSNLITNAIKFSKRNDRIEIDVEKSDGYITIHVSDTGVGMDDNTLGKLFKVDEVMKTKGTSNEPGTGLGLILCKEFVDLHKGKIWVESKIGFGSRFSFTLPEAKH